MNIAGSILLYRLLLHLYPRTFLREYGAALEQGFRDLVVRVRERGRLVWRRCAWHSSDLAKSLLMEHLPKEGVLNMKVSIAMDCGVRYRDRCRRLEQNRASISLLK
jgi:hypothetical protein